MGEQRNRNKAEAKSRRGARQRDAEKSPPVAVGPAVRCNGVLGRSEAKRGEAISSSALLTGVNPDRVPAQTGGRKTL